MTNDHRNAWGLWTRGALIALLGLIPLTAFSARRPAPTPVPTTTLEGRVEEKGTRAPLAGAALLLEQAEGVAPASWSADADAKGTFRFVGVPVGSYRLTVVQPGFARVVEAVTLPTPKALRFYLTRDGFTLPEVLVTARRVPKTAVSRQVLTKQELTHVPGTGGDPLRALQALPGVTSANDYSGQLVVRGGGPNDNEYYLDRIPIMFPFHFGGLISTVNPELIKDVDLSVGAFDAEFGNVWGGVVDIQQRDVRRDRWGGRANINVLMSDLLVEGPVSDKCALALAGRRSYFEVAKSLFDDYTAIPSFGDYQAKFDVHASEKLQMNFQILGSDDLMGLTVKPDSEDAKKDPALAGEFSYHYIFHNQGMNVKWLWSDKDTLIVTPYHARTIARTNVGRDYYVDVTADSFGLRADWIHSFGKVLQWRTGVDDEWQSMDLNAYFARLPEASNTGYTFTAAPKVLAVYKGHYAFLGFFTEAQFEFAKNLHFSSGIRYDRFTYNDDVDISPRLSAAWDLDEATCLKASWGIYHQLPPAQDISPDFGNPNLDNERGNSKVLGLERALGKGRGVRIECYDTDQSRIPIPNDALNYVGEGVGIARGVEVMARQAPTSRLFGWVAYAYSLSKRRNGEGKPWYPYDYEQKHIATVVTSYKLTPKWEVGFKWRVASGQPETPIIGAVWDPVNNYYRPVEGTVNSGRKPVYQRLDLSVSRLASYNTWQLRWYLEILNVTNAKNVMDYDYSADYSSRKEIKQLPFLPYAGVEVKF